MLVGRLQRVVAFGEHNLLQGRTGRPSRTAEGTNILHSEHFLDLLDELVHDVGVGALGRLVWELAGPTTISTLAAMSGSSVLCEGALSCWTKTSPGALGHAAFLAGKPPLGIFCLCLVHLFGHLHHPRLQRTLSSAPAVQVVPPLALPPAPTSLVGATVKVLVVDRVSARSRDDCQEHDLLGCATGVVICAPAVLHRQTGSSTSLWPCFLMKEQHFSTIATLLIASNVRMVDEKCFFFS